MRAQPGDHAEVYGLLTVLPSDDEPGPQRRTLIKIAGFVLGKSVLQGVRRRGSGERGYHSSVCI